MHVFGPPDRYPGAPDRTYAPSPKPLAEYRRMRERLGLARVVLVQPSAYGTDNRALLDTLGQGAPTMRAVAVIDGSFGADTLRSMHHAGVRGIRLNQMSPRITETAAARALLQGAADQVAPLLPDLPVPVVFDHMGGARARLGLQEPGFRLLCTLLAREHCWAKLSGADIVAEDDHQLDEAVDFARALVAANPARLVWGTDWPHLVHQHAGIGDAAPSAGYRPVDETALLDVLRASLDGAPAWRAILVDNPARLYGF